MSERPSTGPERIKERVMDVLTLEHFQEIYKRFGVKKEIITIIPEALRESEWGTQLEMYVDHDPNAYWSEFATDVVRFPKSELLFKPIPYPNLFPKKCFMNPGRRSGQRRVYNSKGLRMFIVVRYWGDRRKTERRQNLMGWSDAAVDK